MKTGNISTNQNTTSFMTKFGFLNSYFFVNLFFKWPTKPKSQDQRCLESPPHFSRLRIHAQYSSFGFPRNAFGWIANRCCGYNLHKTILQNVIRGRSNPFFFGQRPYHFRRNEFTSFSISTRIIFVRGIFMVKKGILLLL